MKDTLPGGLADNKQPADFDASQLGKGKRVEMEHVDEKNVAREIAMDHLTEDPKYYDKLEKMEGEKEGKIDWDDHLRKLYARRPDLVEGADGGTAVENA